MQNLSLSFKRSLGSVAVATTVLVLAPSACESSKGSRGSGLWGTAGSDGGGRSDGGASGRAQERGGESGGGESGGGESGGGRSIGDCATNAECTLGEQCVDGVCLNEAACRNSLGCETELVCSTTGRCVECVDDVECDSVEQCVGNACRPSCVSDRNCTGQGLLCDRGVRRCVECLVAEDCPKGRGCVGGTCMTTVLGTGGSAGGGGEGEGGSGRGGSRTSEGGADGGRGGDAAEGGSEAEGGAEEASGGIGQAEGGSAGQVSTATAGRSSDGGDAGVGGLGGEGGAAEGGGGTQAAGGIPGAGGATLGFCGDGQLDAGESCDDGNSQTGDCCSSSCAVEPGCTCVQVATDAATVALPAVHRDFLQRGDFEPDGAMGLVDPMIGLVDALLDADGRPVFVGRSGDGFITSADSFAEWYRDVPEINETLLSTLVLYRDAAGNYVNRFGASGEQWSAYSSTSQVWCGSVGMEEIDLDGNPIPCTYCTIDADPEVAGCQGREETECEIEGTVNSCILDEDTYYGTWVNYYDGDPLFFPVDSMTFTPSAERSAAVVPPYYGSNWASEAGQPLHNFHFTSEFHLPLQFTGNQVLEVGGDDDVWVFIDGKLAADVGGIHTPVDATITLDTEGNAKTVVGSTEPTDDVVPTVTVVSLGLDLGRVYDVAIFQAERKKESSTFRVKLQNFAFGISQCAAQPDLR